MVASIRLVVVGKDLRTRGALLACLETVEGVRVIGQASDVLSAIPVIESNRPDLALLDVRLPDIGGFLTVRLLKDRWPDLKILVLSLYAETQLEAEAAGADAFLLKSGSLQDLVQTIRSLAPA